MKDEVTFTDETGAELSAARLERALQDHGLALVREQHEPVIDPLMPPSARRVPMPYRLRLVREFSDHTVTSVEHVEAAECVAVVIGLVERIEAGEFD